MSGSESLLDEFMAPGRSLRLGWRESVPERPESLQPRVQEEASTSEAPNTTDAGFVTHKINKLDKLTLAGIAIKYSVPIADIKRFNGLMSDSALHGLDTLLIPTKLQPVSKEVQQMFAQIATGLGRDPVVHSEQGIHQPTSSHSQMPRALDRMDSTALSEVPWWCRCGTCSPDEDADMAACNRTLASEDQRLPESLMPSSESAGPSRFHEQMRRRYLPVSSSDEAGGERHDITHAHSPRSSCSPAVQASAATILLSSIGKKIGESGSALMQKLKQAAASQPTGSGPAWGHHNMLSSLRQGLLPKGNISAGRQDGTQLRASSHALPHQKVDNKCD